MSSGLDTERSTPEMILVRYGELSLKGGNRQHFETVLQRNIGAALKGISKARVERRRGRIVVFPERRHEAVSRRLQEIFGIVSVSPAWGVEPEVSAIARTARTALADALRAYPPDEPVRFRVTTRRGDKRFPVTSTELNRTIADAVLEGYPNLVVDLSNAELELGIDVRRERAYVFGSRLPGPGGLPVGTLGKVTCLISGGFDSPVAAWLAMKRGCRVIFVTFHSYPYIGEPARKRVVDIVKVLARYQPLTRLYVAPFAPIQIAIRDTAPPDYRTVLYRRMMQRIATRISAREGARALVTGECVGQVASQTLENMSCIAAASHMNVLRPVVTYDKLEVIDLARRIGTHDLSSVQEPDCCTVFQPDHPVVRGRLHECEAAEEGLDVEGLVTTSASEAEMIDLDHA